MVNEVQGNFSNSRFVREKTIKRKVDGVKQEITIKFAKDGSKSYFVDGKQVYVASDGLFRKKTFTTEKPSVQLSSLNNGDSGIFNIEGYGIIRGKVCKEQNGHKYIESSFESDNGLSAIVRYVENEDGIVSVSYRKNTLPNGSGVELFYDNGELVKTNKFSSNQTAEDSKSKKFSSAISSEIINQQQEDEFYAGKMEEVTITAPKVKKNMSLAENLSIKSEFSTEIPVTQNYTNFTKNTVPVSPKDMLVHIGQSIENSSKDEAPVDTRNMAPEDIKNLEDGTLVLLPRGKKVVRGHVFSNGKYFVIPQQYGEDNVYSLFDLNALINGQNYNDALYGSYFTYSDGTNPKIRLSGQDFQDV